MKHKGHHYIKIFFAFKMINEEHKLKLTINVNLSILCDSSVTR